MYTIYTNASNNNPSHTHASSYMAWSVHPIGIKTSGKWPITLEDPWSIPHFSIENMKDHNMWAIGLGNTRTLARWCPKISPNMGMGVGSHQEVWRRKEVANHLYTRYIIYIIWSHITLFISIRVLCGTDIILHNISSLYLNDGIFSKIFLWIWIMLSTLLLGPFWTWPFASASSPAPSRASCPCGSPPWPPCSCHPCCGYSLMGRIADWWFTGLSRSHLPLKT